MKADEMSVDVSAVRATVKSTEAWALKASLWFKELAVKEAKELKEECVHCEELALAQRVKLWQHSV